MYRVTGRITAVDSRNGVSAKTGNPWEISEYSVLVAERSIATVSKFVDLADESAQPKRGDSIDWAVEIESFGGRTNVNYVAPWDIYTTE